MNSRLPVRSVTFFVLLLVVVSLSALPGALYPSVEGEVVDHGYFVLDYSEDAEQARWVAYLLEKEHLVDPVPRTDDFRSDPLVSTGSASLDDYYKSGYDRGHLVPARDMAFSVLSMSETFVLSNMSPQFAGFNRGIWSELEALVRKMAYEEGTIFVITGPVLNGQYLHTIGPNDVPVPKFYYKVILTKEDGAIAILLPNTTIDEELDYYVYPVDVLEEFSGINFFAGMAEADQVALESSYNPAFWYRYFPLLRED